MTTVRSTDPTFKIPMQVGDVVAVNAPPGSSADVRYFPDIVATVTVAGGAQSFPANPDALRLDVTCTAGAVDCAPAVASSGIYGGNASSVF